MAIISISGQAGVGKDLVGKIIQSLIVKHTHNTKAQITNEKIAKLVSEDKSYSHSGWQIKKWATAVKKIASLITNIPIEKWEDQNFKRSYMGEEWNKFIIEYKHIDKDGIYTEFFDDQEEFHMTYKYISSRYKIIRHGYFPITHRQFLQLLGTNAMRDGLHKNCWVNALMSELDRIPTSEDLKRLKSIWKNMRNRCNNPNYEKYHKYGGAGIKITPEWDDFDTFVKWSLNNGYTQELSLDRKNGLENYSPNNCRWVTFEMQSFNKNIYCNNQENVQGVSKSFQNKVNPFVAQIQFRGKKENLGYYKSPEEAHLVYNNRRQEILQFLEKESEKLRWSDNFIITDTRFENELQAVKDRGGICIRVNRKIYPTYTDEQVYDKLVGMGFEFEPIKEDHSWYEHTINEGFTYNDETGLWKFDEDLPIKSDDNHPSETAWRNWEFDYVIKNNKDIPHLVSEVETFLKKFNII